MGRIRDAVAKWLQPIDSRNGGGWRNIIGESFAGAWQQGVTVEENEGLLRFSAVYACVSGISGDIAKLPLNVLREDSGINVKQRTGRAVDVLAKPNKYQTRYQFVQQFVLSKVLHGNTYCLKVRDTTGKITGLVVLDPENVTVLVSDSGDIYYKLRQDNLSGTTDVTIPSSEIIHDRHTPIFHPLVGVSPIYACGMSATLGNSITNASAAFFKNKSTPSGLLSAPGRINDDTATRLKEHWQREYSGTNAGKIAVLGDGLKFERMTVSAVDAQLIEQLRWSVEDVARAFRFPLFKLQAGAPIMAGSAEELNLQYYSDTLQPLIEAMEAVLNDGMELPSSLHVEFDVEGLGRMNTEARFRTAGESLKVASHNEARARLNLPPIDGGDSVYSQVQNYALSDLVKLRQLEFEKMAAEDASPTPVDTQTPTPEEQTRSLIEALRKGLHA
jgi:HK97 family phage portal protein